jgi:hypothetical protein
MWIVHRKWSINNVNCVGSIIKLFLVVALQINPFFALEKWKVCVSCTKNSLRQHCLLFQIAHFCTIQDHFNKLCHVNAHDIFHLARKSWMFVRDSSFIWILFFKVCNILSLIFLMANWSHKMTKYKGFPFLISYAILKMH